MSKNSKRVFNKILIVLIIIGLITLFKVFNLGEYLSLSYIKESRENFQVLYNEHRIAVIAAYMGIYILVTSLSLPGAAVMTLAGRGGLDVMLSTWAFPHGWAAMRLAGVSSRSASSSKKTLVSFGSMDSLYSFP